MNNIQYYVLSALVVLISLTFHEYSHGYAAYKLGDPTARNLGRLTLNPIKHLDIFGALSMIFFHIGWAKPVPINPRYFKKPKRDFALTASAGPICNIIISYLACAVYLLLLRIFSNVSFNNTFLYSFALNSVLFFQLFHVINLGFALFNLIPLPPLDGSRMLYAFLPPRLYFGIMKHERNIQIAFILWIFLGNRVSDILLSVPFVAGNTILSALARFLGFSNIFGSLIELVSGLMLTSLSFI